MPGRRQAEADQPVIERQDSLLGAVRIQPPSDSAGPGRSLGDHGAADLGPAGAPGSDDPAQQLRRVVIPVQGRGAVPELCQAAQDQPVRGAQVAGGRVHLVRGIAPRRPEAAVLAERGGEAGHVERAAAAAGGGHDVEHVEEALADGLWVVLRPGLLDPLERLQPGGDLEGQHRLRRWQRDGGGWTPAHRWSLAQAARDEHRRHMLQLPPTGQVQEPTTVGRPSRPSWMVYALAVGARCRALRYRLDEAAVPGQDQVAHAALPRVSAARLERGPRDAAKDRRLVDHGGLQRAERGSGGIAPWCRPPSDIGRPMTRLAGPGEYTPHARNLAMWLSDALVPARAASLGRGGAAQYYPWGMDGCAWRDA
jgi:hypothetical protein